MVVATSATVLAEQPHVADHSAPTYTADGQLRRPDGYREWIYLTSGIDMSYRKGAGMADHSMFDNVFVGSQAYRAFLRDGHWPDKTVLVLEFRSALRNGSINQSGDRGSRAGLGPV
jgi:hypothetical protein